MPAAQTAAIQLHTLTYNWTPVMQLVNTPPLQSTTPGLHPVGIHQTSPPVQRRRHLITPYYSVYRPRKDERLSWPSWLTGGGRFTHISSHQVEQVERRTGEFAGRRPTFIHCAALPTSQHVCTCVQTLLDELIYFAIRYIPSVLVCIGCHAANLFLLCSVASTAAPAADAVANDNTQSPADTRRDDVTCHLAFGNV